MDDIEFIVRYSRVVVDGCARERFIPDSGHRGGNLLEMHIYFVFAMDNE